MASQVRLVQVMYLRLSHQSLSVVHLRLALYPGVMCPRLARYLERNGGARPALRLIKPDDSRDLLERAIEVITVST